MSSKILIITCCDECPHLLGDDTKDIRYCDITCKGLYKEEGIPDWCPLPDTNEFLDGE